MTTRVTSVGVMLTMLFSTVLASVFLLGPQAQPAHAGTFSSPINNIQISPSGHPDLCWTAASAANRAGLTLQPCSDSNTLQRFNITTNDQILLSSNTALCVDNYNNSNQSQQVMLTNVSCRTSDANSIFTYHLQTSGNIPSGAFHNARGGCVNVEGGQFRAGTRLITYSCSATAANERFSIGHADMQTTDQENPSGRPGTTVTAQLQVRNAGPQVAVGNSMALTASGGFQMTSVSRYQAASTAYGACTVSGGGSSANCPAGSGTWSSSGTTTGQLHVTGTIPSNATPGTTYEICGTHTSQVTNDRSAGNNQGCATVTVTAPEADFEMTTSGAPTATTNVTSGQTNVSIPFRAANNGPSTANPTLTFSVPEGLQNARISHPAQWDCDQSTFTCTRALGPMVTGSTASFNVIGAVAADQEAGSVLGDVTGTASVPDGFEDPDSSNDTATHTLQVRGDLSVSMAKESGSDTVNPGDEVTFSVTAENTGPNRVQGATVTDELPAGLTDVTWTCEATGSGSSCGDASGSGDISQTVNVSSGGGVTYTITGTVESSAAGTTITNTARVTTPSGTTNSGTASSSASVTVRNTSDLEISGPEDPVVLAPGASGTMPVTVTNNGPVAISEDATVTITVPEGITISSAPSGCSVADGTLSCTISSLANGSSTTFQVPVTASSSAPAGSAEGQGTVSYALDRDEENNEAALEFTILDAATDFAVESVTATEAVTPGQSGTLTAVVVNHGPSTSTSATTVTVVLGLPPNASFADSELPEGCALEEDDVVCEIPAGVGPGDTVSFEIPFTVLASAEGETSYSGGDITVYNDADQTSANDTSTWSFTTGARQADMQLTKSAEAETVAPGEEFSYTLSVTNAGPSYASGPVTVVDNLPSGLVFVDADSEADSCDASESDGVQQVTCAFVGDFAVDREEDIVLTVRLDPGYGGDGSELNNEAEVESPSEDPDPGSNADEAAVTPGARSANLTLEKEPTSDDPIGPGDSFGYTVTVTNNGPSTARDITVSDQLPDDLAFLASPDECLGTEGDYGGEVECEIAEIAPDSSATVTFTVRLSPDFTGSADEIQNVATASSEDAEDDATNDEPAGLPGGELAAGEAEVTVSKRLMSNGEVAPGEPVSYAITVTNQGPATAYDVAVSDALPSGLIFESSPDDCTADDEGVVSCEPLDSLAVDASHTYMVTVLISPDYTPDDGAEAITNQAEASWLAPGSEEPQTAQSDPEETGTPDVGDPIADLSIHKDIPDEYFEPGSVITPDDPFEYVLTVTNRGPSTATGITVTDALPEFVSFVSSEQECDGETGVSGAEVTCSLDSLAAGETAEITLSVLLDEDYDGDGSDISNQAEVSAETTDPEESNNEAVFEGLPVDPSELEADVAITKDVVPDEDGNAPTVRPGEEFSYELSVENLEDPDGGHLAVSPRIEDTLGEGMSFASWSAGCEVSEDDSQVLTCGRAALGAAVAPGESSRSVVVTVRIDADFTGQAEDLVNTAVASSASQDPDEDNNEITVEGGIELAGAEADLGVEKRLVTDGEAVPGQRLEYELIVTNDGPSAAQGFEITDELPEGLSYAGGSGTSEDGVVTWVHDGPLNPGESRAFTFYAQIDPAFTGDAEELENQAVVASETTDPDEDNNTSEAVVPSSVSAPETDLSIGKELLTEGSVTPGETVDYRITVSNDGPSAATGVQVQDELPDALEFVGTSNGACEETDGVVSCDWDALAPGASQSITLTVRLAEGYLAADGDVENTATLDAETIEETLDDSATLSAEQIGDPEFGVEIRKSVDASSVVPGEEVDFTIEVTNQGPSTARDITVTDDLPDGLSFVDVDEFEETIATLPVGETESFTVTVLVDPDYLPDEERLINEATAAWGEGDDAQEASATAAVPVSAPRADLSMVKEAQGEGPVSPGEQFGYTLTATNDGPSTAQNVRVTDRLPAGLSLVSIDSDNAEDCTADAGVYGGAISCQAGSLAPGDSVEYEITVQLDPAYTGNGSDIVNEATVTSPTSDPNPENNTATASVPGSELGQTRAELSLEKTAQLPDDAEAVTAGEDARFTIEVTNDGPAVATGVTVIDTLPEGATLTGTDGFECAQDGQEITCALGTVEVGETVSITLDVALDASYEAETLTNSATVTADDHIDAGDEENRTDQAVVDVVTVSELSLTTEAPSSLAAGGQGSYTAVISNAGPSDAQDAVVTYTIDEDDEHMMFVSEDERCEISADGRTITCTLGTVAAGETVELPIGVQLAPSTPADYEPALSGTATASNAEEVTSTPSEVPNVAVTADIAVVKNVLGEEPFTPGEEFEYSITVTNEGPAAAADVELIDALPETLRFVSITRDEESAAECEGDTETFGADVTCELGTLAPDDEVTYLIRVQLAPWYAGTGESLENSVRVQTSTDEAELSNNSDSAGLPTGEAAAPAADLSIEKALAEGTGSITPGETFSYDISVHNAGPSDAVNPAVVDQLPEGLIFVSGSTDDDWECTAEGQVVNCLFNGSMVPGDTDSLTITVRLDPAYTGDGTELLNQAEVFSETEDPDLSNNSTAAEGPESADPSSELTLIKTMNPLPGEESVAPGGEAEVQLIAYNRGPSVATNVQIVDQLPDELAFVSADSECSGDEDVYGGELSCSVASLGVQERVYFSAVVRVDPSFTGAGGDIQNIATLTSNTSEPVSNADDPADLDGWLSEPTADLGIDKSIDPASIDGEELEPGETFDFVLTASNSGPSTATGVTVTDTLPEELSFVSSSSGCEHSSGTVDCTLDELAAGDTAEFTLTVRLDADYTGDGEDVVNTAEIGSAEVLDPNAENDSDRASVPAGQPTADLVLEKTTDSEEPVAPGETFSYELAASNDGPSGAAGVVVSDTVPEQLSVEAAEGCEIDGQSVTCPVGALASGAQVSFSIEVRLDPGYIGDGSEIINSAVVTSDTLDLDTVNNRDAAPVPGGEVSDSQAQLSTGIDYDTGESDSVRPGETLDVLLGVHNEGPSTARNVELSYTLPAGFELLEPLPEGCAVEGRTVTCLLDELVPGDDAEFALSVRIDPAYDGDGSDLTSTVTAGASNAEEAASEPSDLSEIIAEPQARLAAEASMSSPEGGDVRPGQDVDVSFTVSNSGPSTATNVEVVYEVPEHLEVDEEALPEGCTLEERTVTCLIDQLAPGQSVELTIPTRIDPAYDGDGSDITAVAVVGSPQSETVESEPVDLGDALLDPLADLEITKAAVGDDPVVPGETFDYELTVTNHGPSSATGVVITDELPSSLAFVSSSGCEDAAEEYGAQVECELGTLAVEESQTVTVTVRLDPSYTGDGSDIVNTARVSAATEDNDESNNTTEAGVPGGETAEGRAELSLEKAFDVDGIESLVPGGTVPVTLTVTNEGPSTAREIVITDQLPSELDFVSSASGCAPDDAEPSVVECPEIASLAVGSSATATLLVQLDPDWTSGDVENTAEAASATSDETAGAEAVLPASAIGEAEADLWIDKSVDLSSFPDEVLHPGESFDFVLTVGNSGPSTAREITVEDLLPAELEFDSSSECEASGQEITCGIEELAVGETVDLRITAVLDGDYDGDGSDVQNSASVSSATTEVDDSDNTDTSTVPAGQALADLQITKEADSITPPAPGETFTYELTVSNAGPSAAQDVVVTDQLPEELALVSASEQCEGDLGEYGAEVECDAIETLRVGYTHAVTYTLEVRLAPDYLGDGGDVLNTASVTSATEDLNTLNNSDEAGLPGGSAAAPNASLDLDASFTPAEGDTLAPGEDVSIGFTISNEGPSTARDVVFSYELPEDLELSDDLPENCALEGRTITCLIDEIAPGESVQLDFTAQLNPAYTGDGTDISGSATVESWTSEPVSYTPQWPEDLTVEDPAADLSLVKSASAESITAGESFSYEFLVTNDGPSLARDVQIQDVLPEGLRFSGSEEAGCSAEDEGAEVRCDVGEIAPGESSAVSFEVTLEAAHTEEADLVNEALVTSETADPDEENNESAAVVAVQEPSADLAISKQAVGDDPVAPGETFSYLLTVTNSGPSEAADVVVTDQLPSSLAFVSSQECDGDEEFGATVDCEPAASLAAGDELVFELEVRLDPAYTGDGTDVINEATVEAATADPDESNNTSSASVPSGGTAAGSADLSVTKEFDATEEDQIVPGDTADVTFTVTNDGPSAARDVSVIDELSDQLAFIDSAECQGAAEEYGSTVECVLEELAVGESVELTVTVRLHPSFDGAGEAISNEVTVSAETADPVGTNNSARVTLDGLVAEPSADLSLEKSTEATEVGPGESFDYLLTVTNDGVSSARDVTITDTLPEELSFVEADGPRGCPHEDGEVLCDIGLLEPGQSASVSLTVELSEDYVGDGSDVVNTATASSSTPDPDEENNTDTAEVPAGEVSESRAELSLDAEIVLDEGETLAPGDEVDLRFTVGNDGPSTAREVTVTYPIPEGMEYVSSDGNCSVVTNSPGSVVCIVDELEPGETADITVTMQVEPSYGLDPSEMVSTPEAEAPIADPVEGPVVDFEDLIEVPAPEITVPEEALPGEEIVIEGEDFIPGTEIDVELRDPEGQVVVTVPVEVGEDGRFEVPVEIPEGLEPGDYEVVVVDPETGEVIAEAPITILEADSTPDPTPSESPTPAPTPSDPSTTVPPPGEAEEAGDDPAEEEREIWKPLPGLPVTGAALGWISIIAVTLLLVGLAIIVTNRRRRNSV